MTQNPVLETVPVSANEANTTETKTKSVKKPTLDARNKRFLAFSVWIAQKLSAPLSDTSDSVNIQLSPETLNLLRIFDNVESQKEFYESFNEKLMIDTVSNMVKDRVKEEKQALKEEKKNKTKKVPDENKEKTPKKPRASKKKPEVAAETKTDFEKVVEHESIQPSILLSVSVTPNTKENTLTATTPDATKSASESKPATEPAVSATPVVAEKESGATKKKPNKTEPKAKAASKAASKKTTTEPVVAPVVNDNATTKVVENDEEDNEEELTVDKVIINGIAYLSDKNGIIYDFVTHEPVDVKPN